MHLQSICEFKGKLQCNLVEVRSKVVDKPLNAYTCFEYRVEIPVVLSTGSKGVLS